jgi:hypothetical protein
MTTIGPTFPAHIAVSQAQVRLVADQTANAGAPTIIGLYVAWLTPQTSHRAKLFLHSHVTSIFFIKRFYYEPCT